MKAIDGVTPEQCKKVLIPTIACVRDFGIETKYSISNNCDSVCAGDCEKCWNSEIIENK